MSRTLLERAKDVKAGSIKGRPTSEELDLALALVANEITPEQVRIVLNKKGRTSAVYWAFELLQRALLYEMLSFERSKL